MNHEEHQQKCTKSAKKISLCSLYLCKNVGVFVIFVVMQLLSSSTSFAGFSPSDSTIKEKINRNKHPLHHFYVATGAELIFAFGDLKVDSMAIDNKMRFSIFPHVQQQYHYNFNKALGFYTGISLINVGFKNVITTPSGQEFEFRQRSLSFGVPLALKIGNLENGNYIALGASAELMFHYKYKLSYQSSNIKYTDWFSDKVNLFNPSVFIDLRNKTGGYIRFKYYLNNFLTSVSTSYLLPETSTIINLTPTQSSLFYISIGSTFMKKKPRPLTLDDV